MPIAKLFLITLPLFYNVIVKQNHTQKRKISPQYARAYDVLILEANLYAKKDIGEFNPTKTIEILLEEADKPMKLGFDGPFFWIIWLI